MSATVKVDLKFGPGITALLDALGGKKDAELMEGASTRLWERVREYLREYALDHHETAQKLGAQPTGNLERAEVTKSSDAQSASVTVSAPGIRRVFHSLEIYPSEGKKYLTIPIHAKAYGKRVAIAEKDMGTKIFKIRGKDLLAARTGTGKQKETTFLYALKTHVTIPQDRTLLPDDGEIQTAARKGYVDALKYLLGA